VRRTLFIGAFVCLFAQYAQAIDVTAATCGQAQIQAALVGRVAGDKVRIPAGTCRWATQGTWNIPTGVSVIGAGISQTIIIDNYKPGGSAQFYTAGPLLIVQPGADMTRISGFSIVSEAANSNYKYALVGVYGTTKNFRADNIQFTLALFPEFNAVPTAYEFYGYTTGVLDHSIFNLADRGAAFIVHYNNYGGGVEGDESWAAAPGFGGPDFLFFEDNQIKNFGSGGTVNDCYHAGKWVIRYNDIQGASIGQTHPTGGSGRARGCRAWEAYMNRITLGTNGTWQFNAFFLSSGSGVIWGHNAPQGYDNWITLHSMRVPGSSNYNQTPPPNGWGFFKSIYDMVTAGFDQPGKGRSDLLTGPFPNVRNVTKSCNISATCTPDQATEGVYEWSNTFWSAARKFAVYEPSVLLSGRDYFPDTPKPGYTPYVYPHPLNVPDGGTGPVTPAVPGRLRLDSF
jgi:hypothetical protein